jgi:hypothetical protein
MDRQEGPQNASFGATEPNSDDTDTNEEDTYEDNSSDGQGTGDDDTSSDVQRTGDDDTSSYVKEREPRMAKPPQFRKEAAIATIVMELAEAHSRNITKMAVTSRLQAIKAPPEVLHLQAFKKSALTTALQTLTTQLTKGSGCSRAGH